MSDSFHKAWSAVLRSSKHLDLPPPDLAALVDEATAIRHTPMPEIPSHLYDFLRTAGWSESEDGHWTTLSSYLFDVLLLLYLLPESMPKRKSQRPGPTLMSARRMPSNSWHGPTCGWWSTSPNTTWGVVSPSWT